jgi:hypothetical protein
MRQKAIRCNLTALEFLKEEIGKIELIGWLQVHVGF